MTWIQRARREGLAALAATLALTCGGGDDGPSGSAGSIQIGLNPTTLPVTQGGSGSTVILLTRIGGVSSAVSLAISGLPAGVTATITPTQLSGATASAGLDVSVAASVATGSYTGTVTATSQGVNAATATLQLTVTAAPNYTLSVAPSAVTVAPGSSGNATVNITRTNFTGAVALALLNPPAGITATFTPSSSTTNASALVISVAANVAPAEYVLTVQGTATGVPAKTTTVSVTVTAPPTGYAINVNTASLSVAQGSSGTVNLTLARVNFSGNITLAFENAPAGVTGTLVPSSTTGNSSVLTVNVGAAAAVGIYQVTMRGTATGLSDRVATIQLTVTAPAGSGNVEFQYCSGSVAPVFFAYQNGTAAWQAVTGTTSGGVARFAFTLTQGRGGVLIVFRETTGSPDIAARRLTSSARNSARELSLRDKLRARAGSVAAFAQRRSRADVYHTELLYGSTAELAQDGLDACGQTQGATKTITGTVAGIPNGAIGILSLGNTTETFIGGQNTNPVTFADVPPGLVDFVGTRMLTLGGSPPDRAVVFRNLNIPDGGSFPSTIDFNGSASSVPGTATVAVTGGGTDNLEVFTTVVTPNGEALFWFDLTPSQNSNRLWAGLNPTVATSADFHGIFVFANAPNNLDDFRVTLKYVGPVTNQTAAMGPTVTLPTSSQVAAGTYPRFRFQGTLPAVYDKGARVELIESSGGGNGYSILATGAYLAAAGNASAYDLTMPDVAGLTGFPIASRLTAGTNDLALTGLTFTGPGIFGLQPNVGGEFKASIRVMTIQVP